MFLPNGVGSAQVSDALDVMGIERRAAAGLFGLGRREPVCGPAYPMRAVVASPGVNDRSAGLVAAVDALPRDSVAVIEAAGIACAMLGELTYLAAVARGARGIVCNGLVRDLDVLSSGPVTVYARGATPVRSLGRADIGEHGRRCEFAGVDVAPGDIVVADRAGVVFVPEALARDVIERAERIASAEARIRASIGAGRSLAEAIGAK